MIPGLNESLNNKMEQASLSELMPRFDKEAEWAQLANKLHPPKGIVSQNNWAYAAAIMLLLCCGGWFAWFLTGRDNATNTTAQQLTDVNKDTMKESISSAVDEQSIKPIATAKPAKNNTSRPAEVISTQPAQETKPEPAAVAVSEPVKVNSVSKKGSYNKKRIDELFDYYRTKEFICNGTPCPLQICILQTIKCTNAAPSAVATCSTIEPDQARQLKYKINTTSTHDCNVTIDEIRITRVNTGETIVLNADSKPATAQDMFDYITGEKEGDLLTGIFHSDCNKNSSSQNLTIDKNYGDFIIK